MISRSTLLTSAVLIATVDCSVVQRPWVCQLSHCQRLGRVASPVLTLSVPQSTEHPERLKQLPENPASGTRPLCRKRDCSEKLRDATRYAQGDPSAERAPRADRESDFCLAFDRMPNGHWEAGQMTPLCSHCDNKHGRCHFCRGISWCTPERRTTVTPN